MKAQGRFSPLERLMNQTIRNIDTAGRSMLLIGPGRDGKAMTEFVVRQVSGEKKSTGERE